MLGRGGFCVAEKRGILNYNLQYHCAIRHLYMYMYYCLIGC